MPVGPNKKLKTLAGAENLSFYGTPMLTDLYEITMVYAYWRGGRHKENSVFDLFFRKCPFQGEYCIFAGLEDVLTFIKNFSFSASDVDYLKTILPNCESGFFDYLLELNCSEVSIYAQREGSVVFPRVPLIRVEGPLGICQLLETTLLNLVNFASLITTNAARHRRAVKDKKLLEFGLRRAQGPDGAMSATRYAVMGGFDGTSNVLAGKVYGLAVKGTHAHSFITSYFSMEQITDPNLVPCAGGAPVNFVEMCKAQQKEYTAVTELNGQPNEGEFVAFIAYALAYPTGFLALVDTYDTLSSGIPNFLSVSLTLHQLGYKPVGIRLDSGDLAYLSRQSREMFKEAAARWKVPYFEKLMIVASNNIHEEVLYSLKEQGNSIDAYGIGTHLVTCMAQPALGCVYKLVEVNGFPRIKLSESLQKVTIPGKKNAYRVYGKNGEPILDLMSTAEEELPQGRVLCRHPFKSEKRAYVTPTRIINLLKPFWENGSICGTLPTFGEKKQLIVDEVASLREDYVRYLNPTRYKVSVTEKLFDEFHKLRDSEAPIKQLC